ncbi:TnsA-like heteromeric transposase endonuclease subunit [Streptomyces virginiae]
MAGKDRAGAGGAVQRQGDEVAFDVVFAGLGGQAVQQRWVDAAVTVAFEELEPVSAFPVVPGRRWGPGLWWSATTGRHVACGSNAMRVQLMVLDRDPDIVALAGRPVRLRWHNEQGRQRSWTPQLFARRADGTALLADCPSHTEAGGERALTAAVMMERASEQAGWTYQRLEPLEPVLAANLRWLAGYRHPRNQIRPSLTAAVLEAFTRPRPLIEGVQAVGDPIEVLPAAFHALWNGHLRVPLDKPLHEHVLVQPGTLPPAGDPTADGPRREAGRRLREAP